MHRTRVRWPRRLHYLSFVAFFGAASHGILAGSESGTPWAIALYAIPLAVATMLAGRRVLPTAGGDVGTRKLP